MDYTFNQQFLVIRLSLVKILREIFYDELDSLQILLFTFYSGFCYLLLLLEGVPGHTPD